MDLKNMKMSEKESKEYSPETVMAESPKYPYGLRLSLDEESLAKLGLVELPQVGASMMITAKVEVCSISQYESKEGGADKRMELQITDMGLEAEKTTSTANKLYGE